MTVITKMKTEEVCAGLHRAALTFQGGSDVQTKGVVCSGMKGQR